MGREGDGNASLLVVVPTAWDHKGQSLLQCLTGITRGDLAGHLQGPMSPEGTHLWEMPCTLWKACLEPNNYFSSGMRALVLGWGSHLPALGWTRAGGQFRVQHPGVGAAGTHVQSQGYTPPLSHTSMACTNSRRSPRHCTPSTLLSSCLWECHLLSIATHVAGQR